LLPYNITVFAFDFTGSGLSEGKHVSLGYYEKDDVKEVVKYLRSTGTVSRIG
jgi:alpha/beta superfamily hydrolase